MRPLEGDWSGRTGDSRVALHVITFQVVGFGGEQMRCTGTLTQDGACGLIAITGPADGKIEFAFDDGPDGVLKRN